MLCFYALASFALIASTASAALVSNETSTSIANSNTTILSPAPNATLSSNVTVIYTNGTYALLPNGTIIPVNENSTSLLNVPSSSTSILSSILPTTATTTTTDTVYATATEVVTNVETVTFHAPTPSPVVSVSVETRLTTATVTDVITTTAEPPKPTSIEQLVKELDEAGMMAKILPTVYLTLVPHRESNGHWDYVVYDGADGTATASPTFVSSIPTPIVVAATTTYTSVATTKVAVTSQAAIVEVISSIAAALESSSIAVVSVTATGTALNRDTPSLTDTAVVASLLPTTTPTYVYSIPGETTTVALVPVTTVVVVPTSSEFAHVAPSQAVASAVATGGVVGVVPSSQGNDEPESSTNGTVIGANSTLPSNTSSLAPLPVQTQWNSTNLPLGNDDPLLSNNASISSILSSGAVRSWSASSVPSPSSALPSLATSSIYSIFPLSAAIPSQSAASVLVQTIQMGSSSVVVALPVATASASVEESESGVKSVFVTEGTTTVTETRTSAVAMATESVMRRVMKRNTAMRGH